MPESLQPDEFARLVPLLGSVARLLAHDPMLEEDQLVLLLSGIDMDDHPAAVRELQRWVRVLQSVRAADSATARRTVTETLLLRGLPEAAVLLAVNTVTMPATDLPAAPPRLSVPAGSVTKPLRVTPERLEWTLPSGQGASADLLVVGGPGQVETDSDQVRVTPAQFGPGETHVRVEVRPLADGMIWTSLRLVTANTTQDVPVLAQWQAAHPVPNPSSEPTPLPTYTSFSTTPIFAAELPVYIPLPPPAANVPLAGATVAPTRTPMGRRISNSTLLLWFILSAIGYGLVFYAGFYTRFFIDSEAMAIVIIGLIQFTILRRLLSLSFWWIPFWVIVQIASYLSSISSGDRFYTRLGQNIYSSNGPYYTDGNLFVVYVIIPLIYSIVTTLGLLLIQFITQRRLRSQAHV